MSQRNVLRSRTTEWSSDRLTERTCFFVLAPNTLQRIVWDLLSTMAIAYDLLVLPLDAFEFNTLDVAARVSFGLTCFWTADLILSFCSGYYREDGLIELNWGKIVRRYLRTWFAFDFIILLLDWTLFFADLIIEELLSAGRLNKALRFFRAGKLLRLMRLVRVFKLAALYEELCEFILSSNLMTAMNVARMLMALSIFVHYIACAWYAVGMFSHPAHTSWLTPWVGEAPSYLYVIAFHWTLAQFLPAPCQEHPQNRVERVFTVCTLLTGFVIFSSVIGSITAMITQSRQSAYKSMKEKDLIRRFFADNKVSSSLGNRITHYLAQSTKRKNKVVEADVVSLRTLPETLRMELHFEVHSQFLFNHVLFALLEEVRHPAMMQLCEVAVSETQILKDDEPFHQGTQGTCMRFVHSGVLTYYVGLEDFDEDAVGMQIQTGEHLSEAVLWSDWMHRGLLRALEPARAMNVLAEPLKQVAFKHPTAFTFCCEYAALFMQRLAAADELGALDDTWQAFISRQDLTQAAIDSGMEHLPSLKRPGRRAITY